MPASTPEISVVIATYNRAGFLRETIESILQGSFRNYELIVVDDGSTDNTRDVVHDYQGRIRYVYQQNRGPSAARNLGVRHARAPWIAFQDSDDLSAQDQLETLHAYVRDHPDCAMVFGNGAYLAGPDHDRETIIPAAASQRLARDGVQLVDLFQKSIVRLQAALISKSCYEAIGGHDETLRIAMDLDLAFRLYARYRIAYLDRVLFFYRKHAGNTGRDEDLRLSENIRVIQKLLRDFPEAAKTLGRGRVNRRLAYRYYRLAKGRWKRGDKDAAREALRNGLALRPFALKYRLYQLKWNSAYKPTPQKEWF